jgi:hypothetical protein
LRTDLQWPTDKQEETKNHQRRHNQRPSATAHHALTSNAAKFHA